MPLNSRQNEAVRHGEGPLLVLAGAGSGKTSTMAHRMAHLIQSRGVAPSKILGLSFTNKAARELKDRVMGLLKRDASALTVSTFHSLCVRILRENVERIGFRRDFSIIDQSDQIEVLRGILKRIKIDDRKFDPMLILSNFSRAKSKGFSQDQAVNWLTSGASFGVKSYEDEYSIAAGSSFEKYQNELRLRNAFDFDDLIYYAVEILKDPERQKYYGKKYRFLLVDEYQDTNPSQFEILRFLTATHQNICVVGDDDQSIYAWRGADSSHILNFPKHYPKAKVITLDQNYRSTETILNAANSVIRRNPKRHDKELWSQRGEGDLITQIIVEEGAEESEMVAERILNLAKTASRSWRDFAILYRSNAQARLFEEALQLQQVPYRIVGGMSYLDRKEIRDVLAYWKWIANPTDDASARRVLNWPSRGLGAVSVEAIGTHALTHEKTVLEALSECSDLSGKALDVARSLAELIHGARDALKSLVRPKGPDLQAWASDFLGRLKVRDVVDQTRWDSIQFLVESLGRTTARELGMKGDYSGLDVLGEFVRRLMLQGREADRSETDPQFENQVTLLTLHGAKGLEFPVVFLVGFEDDILPHRKVVEEGADLSEERRLCYVGITRAKDQLFLTRAKHRTRYGKKLPTNPSRFLAEIPEDLVETEDQSGSPELKTDAAREAHEQKVKGFLDQIRNRMR